MELLPDDIIILICQYIDRRPSCGNDHTYYGSTHQYQSSSHKRSNYDSIFCCCGIQALYLTCKRFQFLSRYKYLVCNYCEYETIFTCINYLGKQYGPQYMICNIVDQNRYVGYVERYNGITTKQIRAVMAKSNEGYYVINEKVYEFECVSDIERDIYDKICGKIYEKFNDKEILDFIWGKNCDKKTLIRKQFPIIDYTSHLRHIKLEVASKDDQIFALDKYIIDGNTDKSIQCKKILDGYGIGSYIAYRNKYHYPDRGILVGYVNDHFIYVQDWGLDKKYLLCQEKIKISYQEVSILYLLSSTIATPTDDTLAKHKKKRKKKYNKKQPKKLL
jgi:hypothetical protein